MYMHTYMCVHVHAAPTLSLRSDVPSTHAFTPQKPFFLFHSNLHVHIPITAFPTGVGRGLETVLGEAEAALEALMEED